MGKGGCLRQQVPQVAQGSLQVVIDALAVTRGSFDFGPYERICRSQAVCASGLLWNQKLIQGLCDVSAAGLMSLGQLKLCFLRHPSLNRSVYKADLWAGDRAEKVLTLLCHWRRVSREPERLRQCLSKANAEESAAVQGLVAIFQGSQGSSSSSLGLSGSSSSSSLGLRAASPLPRRLQARTSDVSVVSIDSDGFPRVLSTLSAASTISLDAEAYPLALAPHRLIAKVGDGQKPARLEAALEAAAGVAAATLASNPKSKQAVGKAKATGKQKACNKAKAKATGKKQACNKAKAKVIRKKPVCNKAKAKATGKKQACNKLKQSRTGDLAGWGKIKVVKASAQSYITGWIGEGWKLLVSISKSAAVKEGLHHQDLIDILEQQAILPGMTKFDLMAEKTRLLNHEA